MQKKLIALAVAGLVAAWLSRSQTSPSTVLLTPCASVS